MEAFSFVFKVVSSNLNEDEIPNLAISLVNDYFA